MMPAIRFNFTKEDGAYGSIEFEPVKDVSDEKVAAFYKAYQKLTNNTLTGAQKRADYEDVYLD